MKAEPLLALLLSASCYGIIIQPSVVQHERNFLYEAAYPFIEAQLNPENPGGPRYFSNATLLSEHRGLSHWALYTDGNSLLAWDIVLNSPVQQVLVGLSNVTNIAVDANRGYVFIVEQVDRQADLKLEPFSLVSRYTFEMAPKEDIDGGRLFPIIRIDRSSRNQVYQGSHVTAITIDDDQSILYIADAGSNRITSIHYSPEKLRYRASTGVVQKIYENPTSVSLKQVSALAVNFFGIIIWANSADGNSSGALFSAQADAPDPTTIKVESKMFAKISSLYFKKGLLFFVAPSDTSPTETAIYFKSMPEKGSSSKQINFVSDRFNDVVALATIDNFIYIADHTEGFFAIESTPGGNYAQPVRLPVVNAFLNQEVPKPTAMVVFTMEAVQSLAVGFLVASIAIVYVMV